MKSLFSIARILLVCGALSPTALGQVAVTGRVVDDTGSGIAGARVEIRPAAGGTATVASSDATGKFTLALPAEGDYSIRAERLGFFLYTKASQTLTPGATDLIITLNHLQEFADKIDVTYSPPAIDPQQPAERKELDNTEIQAVPYPAPQDYRNALPMIDGVVQDNQGRAHFNGGDTNQTNYTMDGFNISDPVTGRLETRVNIDTIQSMTVETSRFAAENGRGSAGILDLATKMGDDRFRFAGTNFIPGISTDSGWHVNKWTPRLEFSGPIAKGRAWFHNGFDAFYSSDVITGLPKGQNRTNSITGDDLSRFQVNLTPSNILTGSFLVNMGETKRSGLSILNPVETTTDLRSMLYMSTLRDQAYLGGALLDVGFADTRGYLRNFPQGSQLYEITPVGNRGNYFVDLDRHFYRQQVIANLFLPAGHFLGTHQIKFGVDFEREAFHEKILRHDYEVLRDDNSVARYVTFAGSPFEAQKNFEGAYYIQDSWTPRDGLLVQAGVREEWNEIVRDLELAPRIAATWAPSSLRDTKFSAGWGRYYDSINLGSVANAQNQISLSTFYLPGGAPQGPVTTSFLVNDRTLFTPYSQNVSAAVERKLPRDFYLRSGFIHRGGNHGFAFLPSVPMPVQPGASLPSGPLSFQLLNAQQQRYDAVEISLRHTFAGRFEWFAGYTRSRARTNAALGYSLENPIFGDQGSGPLPWDTPNRFHTWGWAPLPNRILPKRLRFITRNTTANYLVEYHTGFPFNVVDESSLLVGNPESRRLPRYFDINLHFERQFRALHYLWAWRFGYNNITNSLNPNVVNNVIGTPQYLTYGHGQARAFSVRLRLLGRK